MGLYYSMTKLENFFSDPFGLLCLMLLGLLTMLGGVAILGGCSYEPEDRKHTPSRMVAEVKQASTQVGSVHIQVVMIDGVEYLIAETYRGVSICKKEIR